MIKLTKNVERALRYAVHAQPDLEVGGFAKIAYLDDAIQLTDIIIPPQIVGPTAVSMGDQIPSIGMSGFEWTMIELAKRGETLSDWNCWWHSHSTMPPFASGTDEDTLLQFAAMVEPGWTAGLVTNTHGEYYAWVADQRRPWPTVQKKIDVEVEAEETVEPLYGNIMEMMKSVERGQQIAPTIFTSGSVSLVWCEEHMRWSDECDRQHSTEAPPPRNNLCPHTPNCGGEGCFSKTVRRNLKRDRRAAILAPDSENWDSKFDAEWEQELLGRLT